ncbi:MAG: DUF4147 domain-containing protein [Pseudomonadota bacterium]
MVRAVATPAVQRRAWLERAFLHGVAECHPDNGLAPLLPKAPTQGRTWVFGAGKAAAAMAAVVHARLPGAVGLVVTRYHHVTEQPTGDIRVVEAAHPVPDSESVVAGEQMLTMAKRVAPDDRVLFLFSGGGSALLCVPLAGISVEQKRAATRFLLASGAPIEQINCVRKHLSSIKGGRLGQAVTATDVQTYVISDVVGDDPRDVASGPSIAPRTTPEDAIRTLRDYAYPALSELLEPMRAAAAVQIAPHPVHVVGRASAALSAIERFVAAEGWHVINLGDAITGDATKVGEQHAKLVRHYSAEKRPIALVSGGELTVKIRNPAGRGGPNLEYLASLVTHLDRVPDFEALACDSDGIDGSEDNAGAYVSSTTLRRAELAGLDVRVSLRNNDTYSLFHRLGDLVVTGPTCTNVNDLRIILININAEM